jgi:hypothetical protein
VCATTPRPRAGCGSGLAHAVIQVQDYTPGDEFQLSNMVSFFYVSSKYSSGFTPQFGFAIAAGRFQDVPPGTPFATDLTFLFWDNAAHTSQSIFETFSFFNDFWCFNACGHDVGNSSTFVQAENAAVPEPSALVLLGAGLVWLSVARAVAEILIVSSGRPRADAKYRHRRDLTSPRRSGLDGADRRLEGGQAADWPRLL